jgi:hypothetical protein
MQHIGDTLKWLIIITYVSTQSNFIPPIDLTCLPIFFVEGYFVYCVYNICRAPFNLNTSNAGIFLTE